MQRNLALIKKPKTKTNLREVKMNNISGHLSHLRTKLDKVPVLVKAEVSSQLLGMLLSIAIYRDECSNGRELLILKSHQFVTH